MSLALLPPQVDVLIIGAGPAGTTAAALFQDAGLSTCIVERERFPRFVIGESLLPRCMDLLEEAGLLEAVTARGYLVKRGALFLRGSERCSYDFSDQFTAGWTYTWQVPRADFDHTLATSIQARGIPICFEHRVTEVALEPNPLVTVEAPDGRTQRVDCRFVFDASGYGRVLPRLLSLDEPSGLPLRQAIFTHVEGDIRPEGPEEGRIWVIVHPMGGWLWIIPFSTGITSVGAVGDDAFFSHFLEDPDAALKAALEAEPNASARLRQARPLWPAKTLRGYSASIKRLWGKGYCLVGNATEFLDPVFSSGVTLAMESANLAAKCVIQSLHGADPNWDENYVRPMMAGIDVFRTFVQSWYDGRLPRIFFAGDQDPEVRRQICSVLAGYVWDTSNPFVAAHARSVTRLATQLTLRDQTQ